MSMMTPIHAFIRPTLTVIRRNITQKADVTNVVNKDTWPSTVPIVKDSPLNKPKAIIRKEVTFSNVKNTSLIVNLSTTSKRPNASLHTNHMPE